MMKLQMLISKHSAVIILALLIALLGRGLRLHLFYAFPPPLDTHDEYKSVFNGISLLTEGVPKSWSWFVDYKNVELKKIGNTEYRLVAPWFEEPPFFALVTGAYALSRGITALEKVEVYPFRRLMIEIGTVNIILLFILVYMLGNIFEATVASLIYATEPTVVLSSRLPLAENMLVTLVLASLILFVVHIRSKSNLALISSAIIAALAFLTKQTGIFVAGSLIFLAVSQKKYRACAVIFLFFAGAFTVWLVYGSYYDWDLFTKLIPQFSGRELVVPTNVINFFRFYRISETALNIDPWLIWGWMCVVAYSLIKKPNKVGSLSRLVLPVVIGSYLVFFSIMSGHNKGWYRFPFYPFLAWASGALFWETLKNPKFLLSFFFLAIPVSGSYVSGNGERNWLPAESRVYQFVFPLITAPSLLYDLTTKPLFKLLTRGILVGAMIFALVQNIRTIVLFSDQFWY